MNYRIEKKESFKVVGKSIPVTTKYGENFKIIPKFWQENWADGTMQKILPRVGSLGVMGICYDFKMEEETFRYMIATQPDKIGDLLQEVLEIPELTWAVFPGEGTLPDSMQKLWKQIFNEWFPATDYEHDDGPELEIYLSRENDIDKYEIWVPVIHKK